jgi:hypothetical protein
MVLPEAAPTSSSLATSSSTVAPTERAVVVALDAAPPGTHTGPAPLSDDPATPDTPGTTPAERVRSGEDRGSITDRAAHSHATWRISPGEHLWHVATVVLTDHLAHPPADPEVAAYLTALVETNRHRLVVPTDPDLVMVGQVFDLPDPASIAR